jgi:hypothetical protein
MIELNHEIRFYFIFRLKYFDHPEDILDMLRLPPGEASGAACCARAAYAHTHATR